MYCTFSNPPVRLYTTYLNWQSDHGCWSLFAFQLQKHLHFIKKTWGGSSSVHLKEEPWYPESVFAACWICNHAFVGKWKGLCAQALSSQTKWWGKYNPACIHTLALTHTNIPTWKWLCIGKHNCQDTQEPNRLFPLRCVSNLLTVVAKSSSMPL